MTFDLEASLATLDTTAGHTQSFNGVSIWKSVDDLARYDRIIRDTQPEFVIETGTRWGGFALLLAERYGLEVLTIDTQRTRGDAARHPRITMLQASSVSQAAIDKATLMSISRRTMVTLDSDHHADHVRREIDAYARLVTPGCYLVVEDTIADLADEKRARQIGGSIPEVGGPMRALGECMATLEHRYFTQDTEIEALSPITHSPRGWWRRAC